MTNIHDLAAHTAEQCRVRLASEDLRDVVAALTARGVSLVTARGLVGGVTESTVSQAGIQRLKDEIGSTGIPIGGGHVERALLLWAAVEGLPHLGSVPVTERVKELTCDEVLFLAAADSSLANSLAGTSRFVRLAKIVTNTRWPAGQFEWEISGISRRDLLNVSPARLPSALAFVALRMGGLGPVFFSHLNPRRSNTSLREDESNRSYYQMAESLRLQPAVIGFGACSWFRSPSTHAVSPNLAWMSRVFVENGGWVGDAGPAGEDCGVLYRSSTRRRLYEEGKFKPRRGLVMWPRSEMLSWAAAHPELGPASARAEYPG